MLLSLLLLLTIISWAYWLIACTLVLRFFRPGEGSGREFAPPVSILKPVRGLDFQALENFASFCQQDYTQYEILFGVDHPADPAVPVIEQLQRDCPESAIRLIVAPPRWPNRKASLLHALAGEAQYDILVASDSDMRVTPDYVRRVVRPLADPGVGLVTCPYRGMAARNLAAGLEALYLGSSWLPNIVVARSLIRMRFALGTTVALRRVDLQRIGGFQAIAGYLADDYQLGAQISDLGLRVVLSDYVVTTALGAPTMREVRQREVRWARCQRVSRPAAYPGLFIVFSTLLASLALLASGFSALGWIVLGISLLLRWLVTWLMTGASGDREARRWLVWLPLRDLLTASVWCAGAVRRSVVWRGQTYTVRRDGRMEV
jgi:ceramide glucosyltransferase